MNIGFDLDRIFINTPPFIPNWIIDKLYKERDNGVLLYRIPGTFEQKIRQLSHIRYFRPAITENIIVLKELSESKKHKIFLVSSRFGFLNKQTQMLMQKYGLTKLFKQIYCNINNEQPHEFKNRVIQEKRIDVFVDDDLSLLTYLAKKNPKKNFYWLNNKENLSLSENLYAISRLQNFLTYANK